MSDSANNPGKFETTVYFIVIVGLFLLMFKLVAWSRTGAESASIDATRVAERLKALEDLRKSAKEQFETYAFIDEAKGQVRLPINRAMEIILKEWQDPAAARAELAARWDRFNPPPPPPPPEAPSEFE